MEARKATQAYRMRQWTEKIRECKNSAMTVQAWCESQNINIKSYYYWQRKVREAASSELMKAHGCDFANGLVPSGWEQLKESEHPGGEGTLTIDVSGCRITATEKTDPKLLAKVCRILRSL